MCAQEMECIHEINTKQWEYTQNYCYRRNEDLRGEMKWLMKEIRDGNNCFAQPEVTQLCQVVFPMCLMGQLA